ncbi:MAG: hypothetical protein ACR2MB_15885 [Acidimicrobiales bacterium]
MLVVVVVVGAVLVMQARKDANLAWPASSAGRARLGQTNIPAPDVTVTAAPGVYVWQDFDGIHVWVVNGGSIGGARGTISSDKDIGSAKLAIPGKGRATLEGKTITFDLPADPKLVGVDFNPDFFVKDFKVDIRGPGGPIDPKLVTIGPKRKVSEVPFVIKKVQKQDAPTS